MLGCMPTILQGRSIEEEPMHFEMFGNHEKTMFQALGSILWNHACQKPGV